MLWMLSVDTPLMKKKKHSCACLIAVQGNPNNPELVILMSRIPRSRVSPSCRAARGWMRSGPGGTRWLRGRGGGSSRCARGAFVWAGVCAPPATQRGLQGFPAQGNAGLVWLGVFSFVVVFLFRCRQGVRCGVWAAKFPVCPWRGAPTSGSPLPFGTTAPLAAPSERPAALGAGVPAGWGRGVLGGPACNPPQNSSCFGVSLPGLWQLFQPPAGALLLAPPLAPSFC